MGIVEYLEAAGVTVRWARGGWQPVKCPYHEDRTASASVNVDKDRFHCFACDISEDLVGLMRKDRGVGYVEAVAQAAKEFGTGAERMAGEPSHSSLIPPRQRHRTGHGGTVPAWRSSFA